MPTRYVGDGAVPTMPTRYVGDGKVPTIPTRYVDKWRGLYVPVLKHVRNCIIVPSVKKPLPFVLKTTLADLHNC